MFVLHLNEQVPIPINYLEYTLSGFEFNPGHVVHYRTIEVWVDGAMTQICNNDNAMTRWYDDLRDGTMVLMW